MGRRRTLVIVIIIGMPVWLLTALIISIESRGGIFYTQPRVGKDGKVLENRALRPSSGEELYKQLKEILKL